MIKRPSTIRGSTQFLRSDAVSWRPLKAERSLADHGSTRVPQSCSPTGVTNADAAVTLSTRLAMVAKGVRYEAAAALDSIRSPAFRTSRSRNAAPRVAAVFARIPRLEAPVDPHRQGREPTAHQPAPANAAMKTTRPLCVQRAACGSAVVSHAAMEAATADRTTAIAIAQRSVPRPTGVPWVTFVLACWSGRSCVVA